MGAGSLARQAIRSIRNDLAKPLRLALRPGLQSVPDELDETIRLALLLARLGLLASGMGVVAAYPPHRRSIRSYVALGLLVGQLLNDDAAFRSADRRDRTRAAWLSPLLSATASWVYPTVEGRRHSLMTFWVFNHPMWAAAVSSAFAGRRAGVAGSLVAHLPLIATARREHRASQHLFGAALSQAFLISGIRILAVDAKHDAEHLDELVMLEAKSDRERRTRSYLEQRVAPHLEELRAVLKILDEDDVDPSRDATERLNDLSLSLRSEMHELTELTLSVPADFHYNPGRARASTRRRMNQISAVAYGGSAAWRAAALRGAVSDRVVSPRRGALLLAATIAHAALGMALRPASSLNVRRPARVVAFEGAFALAASLAMGTKRGLGDGGEGMTLRDNVVLSTAAQTQDPALLSMTWVIGMLALPFEARGVEPRFRNGYLAYNFGYTPGLALSLNLLLRGAWRVAERSDARRQDLVAAEAAAGLEAGRRAAAYAIHHFLLQTVDLVLRRNLPNLPATQLFRDATTQVGRFLHNPGEYEPVRDARTIVEESASGYEQFGVRPVVEFPDAVPLAAAPAVALGRAVTEGLSNVLRHSDDREPSIRGRIEGGVLVVEILNGRIVPGQRGAGYGLADARRLAAKCGGRLELGSHVRTAVLRLELPIK
ncbi:MAG: hypothetical protein R2754_18860 [Microthrixaceae bacterium]